MIKNDNTSIELLIKKLIDLTRSSHIKWETIKYYLDNNDNEPLRHFIIEANNSYFSPLKKKDIALQDNKIYCVKINNGIVTLLTYLSSNNNYKYVLCLQNNIYSSVIEINDTTQYQELLSKLSIVLIAKNDDVSFLIDDIMKMQ